MIPVFPEREIEVCLGCESRGPSEDLDSDGLCAECREQIHYSIDLEGAQTIEAGPERAACPCPHCGAKFRPRPFKELISTPSIRDLRTIDRVRRDDDCQIK